MTSDEKTKITWLLDELDRAAIAEVPTLTRLLRRLVDGAHTAQSHAPKRRGRPARAAVLAPDGDLNRPMPGGGPS